MEMGRCDTDYPAMGTKMKGAIVKILRRARLDGPRARCFPGARGPGGYVRLAHTEFKKMFKLEPQIFGPG
jgi:hypothetical protein